MEPSCHRRCIGGLLLPLILAGALVGCASTPGPSPPADEPPLLDLVHLHAVPPAEREDPLELTDAMRLWLRRSVPRHTLETERARVLLQQLQTRHRGGLVYDAGVTATAEEVFRDGLFNCLSFAHLFVAMAREIGVDAYYMVADRDLAYSRKGDLVVSSRHVTSGYRNGARFFTLELNTGPAIDYSRGSIISDTTAQALHYSNRGIERLTAGDLALARRDLATAVAIDPTLPLAWVNLGVALRRTGRDDQAEKAYLHATHLDPGYLPAYGNLAALSRMRGDRQAARRLLDELDRRETRNPYVLLTLGDWRLAEGELKGAQRLYRRAYILAREEAEPRAALGQWAIAAGKREEALRWLDRAREADPESPRVAHLERQLGL